MNAPGARPMIGFGCVRHTRLRPHQRAFSYPTYFLLLPLRSMQRRGSGDLARNRFAPISFYDQDHGDGQRNALAWLDALLMAERIDDADGEVWLQCYPRVLGYTFKPVSFWYCHRANGTLRAVVVEVNNTFGERHVYLLDPAHFGAELCASKALHVSPFCPVQGQYRFRFMMPWAMAETTGLAPLRVLARIDYDDAQGLLLKTSLSGRLQVLNAAALRRAFWSFGVMTLGVIARIHWQALKLFLSRVPFFSKPAPPTDFITR